MEKSKFNFKILFCCTSLLVCGGLHVSRLQAQGSFQNLNFESANNIPSSPSGPVLVAASDAFPGWTIYEGGSSASQVYYNGISLGAPLVTLLGTSSVMGYSALTGNYSATLDAGEGGDGTAMISQTGLIPSFAKSLQFIAVGDVSDSYGDLQVTFGGQSLPLVTLSTGPNYNTYGADISALAGQNGILQFSESPGARGYAVTELDNILFSNQSIPEPEIWALLLCGAGLLGGLSVLRLKFSRAP